MFVHYQLLVKECHMMDQALEGIEHRVRIAEESLSAKRSVSTALLQIYLPSPSISIKR